MKSKVLFLLSCFYFTTVQAEARIHIFAATSLTAPLEELSVNFSNKYQHLPALTFASSSVLARQITQGAPAHLYIAANKRWMDYVENQGALRTNTRKALISNRLVIVGNKNHVIAPFQFSEAIKIDQIIDRHARIAIGDTNHVPVGIYAKEALQSADLWQEWQSYFAPTNSARSALALTERGETPMGIHYKTDIVDKPQLNILSEIPESMHSPIIYEVAKIEGKDTASTSLFYEFLFSEEASNVFKRYGFKTLQDK
ncbi:molybdate ABC transporter substrate-binding protein [Neptuniibacter sp. QD34_54]|uniref:molybdate ABC transporter substrate-binding protein n=1 Tax=Neptuniibacter sp. QD34_54 TaxID=3398208 RepID=UPI0039F60B56